MTLGDLRSKTKDLNDNCNLIMSIYSDNGDKEIINDVDVMGINIQKDEYDNDVVCILNQKGDCMTVKELIIELLDKNMDTEVIFEVETVGDTTNYIALDDVDDVIDYVVLKGK